ncbi:RsmB/NOP family class I SAM-dependent RNA methyltransferase [Salinispirillum sp. LH 10-3-1]|uniref:RsmB/NOP family class I SAM-dependent RNA methyltransferase n=1 Tax=Salinispirillum sp. LH 10-3-1 TaxID=2952525 RepID=A0AB38YI14_9GAMM
MSQALPEFRGYRFPHLNRLWSALCQERELPQLDRWLSRTLREEKAFGRRDRLYYADVLFAAMRYLQTIVLLEQGYKAQDVKAFPEFYRTQDASMTAASLWAEVQALPVESVLFWLAKITDTGGDWPREITDLSERNLFWSNVKQVLNKASMNDVLQGWRPSWQPLLQERAAQSGWQQEDCHRFVQGQNTRPPLWLRVQRAEDQAAIVEQIVGQGYDLEQDGDALKVVGERGIYQLPAWQEGKLEIQDWASQQISRAVDAQPGEQVWDACAGGGGKTLAIASAMNNKGAVTATDIREYKLEEVKKRAKRAGWFNVRRFAWDAEAPLRLPKEAARQNGFDRVLIDAPCSSCGTWRRNPDARWRLTEEEIVRLTQLQDKILSQAAPAVKVGGRLVYATCSWLVAENEARVEAFLAANPGFSLERQEVVGYPAQDADTMFVAVLTRQS